MLHMHCTTLQQYVYKPTAIDENTCQPLARLKATNQHLSRDRLRLAAEVRTCLPKYCQQQQQRCEDTQADKAPILVPLVPLSCTLYPVG